MLSPKSVPAHLCAAPHGSQRRTRLCAVPHGMDGEGLCKRSPPGRRHCGPQRTNECGIGSRHPNENTDGRPSPSASPQALRAGNGTRAGLTKHASESASCIAPMSSGRSAARRQSLLSCRKESLPICSEAPNWSERSQRACTTPGGHWGTIAWSCSVRSSAGNSATCGGGAQSKESGSEERQRRVKAGQPRERAHRIYSCISRSRAFQRTGSILQTIINIENPSSFPPPAPRRRCLCVYNMYGGVAFHLAPHGI